MRFPRRLSQSARVDLIPMIDVVFQLVVFFMVSSTFVLTPGIALDLPQSTSSEQIALNRLVITVRSATEIYLNRERVSMSELDSRLAELRPEGEGTMSAVLEGDKGVSYDLLVSVLDLLRRNGYRGIGLRTLPAAGTPPGQP